VSGGRGGCTRPQNPIPKIETAPGFREKAETAEPRSPQNPEQNSAVSSTKADHNYANLPELIPIPGKSVAGAPQRDPLGQLDSNRSRESLWSNGVEAPPKCHCHLNNFCEYSSEPVSISWAGRYLLGRGVEGSQQTLVKNYFTK
jgi:hypothetical protein